MGEWERAMGKVLEKERGGGRDSTWEVVGRGDSRIEMGTGRGGESPVGEAERGRKKGTQTEQAHSGSRHSLC